MGVNQLSGCSIVRTISKWKRGRMKGNKLVNWLLIGLLHSATNRRGMDSRVAPVP